MPDSLLEGYRRFRAGYYRDHRDELEALAAGQSPQIAVVSCCDSRVDPAVVFDTRPGDLFVIRNVASLVPPCEHAGHYHGTSAALEFAVTGLGVSHIVVLGHAQCGGVHAMLESHAAGKREPQSFIENWVFMGHACLDELQRHNHGQAPGRKAAEQAAVRLSLKNLQTFPWIAERLAAGRISLHGWYYDLATSTIEELESIERPTQVACG